LLVALCSCRQEKVQDLQTAYFNNPSFFEAEIKRLNQMKMGAIKQLKAGDSQGQARVSSIDWSKELEIFRQIDLNKAVYSGKFKVNNFNNELLSITSLDRIQDNINIVNYTKAIDPSSKIIWLEATKMDVSIFTETTTHWRYVPDSGYTIRGEEKIKGLIANTFEVSAVFEPVSN
jgi:hypothetical protein